MNELEVLKESAKLYYRPHGQNSWDHVTQVCSNMEKMTLTLEGRLLELPEMAAGLFHDCSVCFKSGKDRHGYWSAEMSHQTLKRLGFFSDAELREIYVAIVEHETLDKKGGPFTTALGDLLASGDANPPDMGWILNKSWTWGISHGLTPEERLQNTCTYMPKVYGTAAPTKYPSYYCRYYGDRLIQMQEAFDRLTPDSMYATVVEYRASHGLVGDDIRMPDPD